MQMPMMLGDLAVFWLIGAIASVILHHATEEDPAPVERIVAWVLSWVGVIFILGELIHAIVNHKSREMED